MEKGDATLYLHGRKLQPHNLPALVHGQHDGGGGEAGGDPSGFAGSLIKIVIAPPSIYILIALKPLNLPLREILDGRPFCLITRPILIQFCEGLDTVRVPPDVVHG